MAKPKTSAIAPPRSTYLGLDLTAAELAAYRREPEECRDLGELAQRYPDLHEMFGFTGGVLVNGKVINELQPGDKAWVLDYHKGLSLQEIKRPLRRPAPYGLVTISVWMSREADRPPVNVTCSRYQPILTENGWKAAMHMRDREWVWVLDWWRDSPHHRTAKVSVGYPVEAWDAYCFGLHCPEGLIYSVDMGPQQIYAAGLLFARAG